MTPRNVKLEEVSAKVRECGVNLEPMQFVALRIENASGAAQRKRGRGRGGPSAPREPLIRRPAKYFLTEGGRTRRAHRL
jgi:hypothetical protein